MSDLEKQVKELEETMLDAKHTVGLIVDTFENMAEAWQVMCKDRDELSEKVNLFSGVLDDQSSLNMKTAILLDKYKGIVDGLVVQSATSGIPPEKLEEMLYSAIKQVQQEVKDEDSTV